MYIILVYDVASERCGKMLKLCRYYLHWIQNSVFEGAINEVKLKQLKKEVRVIMQDQDSLIIFRSRQAQWLEKEVIGVEKSQVDQFL